MLNAIRKLLGWQSLTILLLILFTVACSNIQGKMQTSSKQSPPVVLILWDDDTTSWMTILRCWLTDFPCIFEPQTSDVFFARSFDGGATFSRPINVSNKSDFAGDPQLGVSGNMVLITWIDGDFPRQRILMKRSIDRGVTFGSPAILSDGALYPRYLRLDASGRTVVVTWAEGNPGGGDDDIFLTGSTDGGSTFSSPINLTKSPRFSGDHQVSIVGDIVLVAWTDDPPGSYSEDIFIVRSTDGGRTFGPSINLSRSPESSSEPRLIAKGDIILVAWQDNASQENSLNDIFLVRSTDRGATFGLPVNLTNTRRTSKSPNLMIANDTVIVTWQDEDYRDNTNSFWVRSTDWGETFNYPVNLSLTTGLTSNPSLEIIGDIVMVAWTAYPSGLWGASIDYIMRSTDGGATFGSPISMWKSPKDDITHFQFTNTGNMILATWVIQTPPESSWLFRRPSKWAIFLTRSTDRGATFEPFIKLWSYTGFSTPRMAFLP